MKQVKNYEKQPLESQYQYIEGKITNYLVREDQRFCSSFSTPHVGIVGQENLKSPGQKTRYIK